LSIVIASWTKARKKKGLVCDCMPSCEEVDILVTHESRTNIFNGGPTSYSTIDVILGYLPTERYKRNVVRGKLDLVGLFKTILKFIFLYIKKY
jgi:acid-sensing ion channel, other